MAVISAILAVFAFQGWLTPWLLLTFTFLIGLGTAMHGPSWQAAYNDLVPREDLPSAVSMNAMGMNVTRSVGPAIGGAIVASLGAAVAFAANAATYLFLIGALLSWKPGQEKRHLPRERFFSGMAAGLRYFLLSPHIVSVEIRGLLFGFAGVAMQALLPLVARDALGGNALVFGLLLGSFGIGAVTGALNAARIRARLDNETIARLCIVLFAICTLVVGLSGFIVLTVVALFISGACWINILSLLSVTVQLASPRWVLGRMISLYTTWLFAGMALGSWVWGAVADSFGLTAAFFWSATAMSVGVFWGLRFPLPQYGMQDLSPLNRFNAPALALDIQRRSGPIFIMVEYIIDQADVTEFLRAMSDRRRIRIRDGARRWALLRDLENPDLWIESYHLPTWTEYIRHNDRRTVADDEVIQRVISLHRGPRPLKIHRMIERETVQVLDDMPRVVPRADDIHH